MTKRIITGIAILLAAIPGLIFSHTHVLTAYVVILALIAGYELLACIGLKTKIAPVIVTIAYVLALTLPSRSIGDEYAFYALAGTFIYIFLMFVCSVLSRGSVDFALAAETAVCVAYSTLGFALVGRLRDMRYGFQMFLLVFIAAFLTDIFAYFVGCAIGRHKLIPDVSPKKTVEGAIGGILGCVLVTVLYGMLLSWKFDIKLGLVPLSLLAVVLSVVSQLGDLVLSQLKRRHGIKDFGKLFPGHGGVLDRFDSVLAVGSFLYLLWYLFGDVVIIK